MEAATASFKSSRPVNGSQLFASSSTIAARDGPIAGSRRHSIDIEAGDIRKTTDTHFGQSLLGLNDGIMTRQKEEENHVRQGCGDLDLGEGRIRPRETGRTLKCEIHQHAKRMCWPRSNSRTMCG